jgi:hypothetical protein
MRVISYGGGVQSTALLVLAAQGKLGRVDAALFSNVGDDSEDPLTLTYVREVAAPYGGERVPVHELHRTLRDGTTRTLMQELQRPNSRSLSIPVRMGDTGAPGRRSCTATYKMKVVSRWLRGHGVSVERPATVMVGISYDEIERLGNRRPTTGEVMEYPLVDCKAIIVSAGLPIPPKSSCFFCPFHKPSEFSRMRRDRPELFERAVALEHTLNERRARLGKDAVYLTRFGKPLADAIQTEQDGLDFGTGPGETCDEGYCWT